MTSLHRRITAIEGGSAELVRCAICQTVGKTVDVAMNLLCAEADGCEGVLDLVGYATGDLFPRGLFLCAKQFGGVFEDDNIALMLATQALGGGGHLEQSDGGEKVHGAGGRAIQLDLAGGRTHPMAAIDEAIEDLNHFRWKDLFHGAAVEGALAAGVHHLTESAVGEHDAAIGVERGDSIGDGFEHGFELAAAGLECGIGSAQLHGGVLDGAATAFEVRGHVIEAANEFAELFGCTLLYAVGVVSGGDGFHGIGESFNRLGDLLR